jgi:branched-chain amino acid transport system substrate-binding protein
MEKESASQGWFLKFKDSIQIRSNIMMKKISYTVLLISLLIPVIFAQAEAKEAIKISAIFAKTGGAAKDNAPNFQGISLAVEEINSQGGLLGRQLEVIELDNRSNLIGSKEAALKTVELGVTAVIGAAWSSHSLAIAPVLQQEKIPMISPISTNPKVTLVGNYIFRVCFIDPFQGKVMAQFTYRDLKARTAIILTNVNSEFSIGLAEFFEKSFTKSGGKVLWEGDYREKAVDFSTVLRKVQLLKPDAVFVPGYINDSALLIKQAREMEIRTIFLGGDGWSGNQMYKYGGKAIEGSYYSQHWHSKVPFPRSQQLQASYRSKYGKSIMPGFLPSVMVLADAIRRAQSQDREKIRDTLAATKNFQGATGTITFDENGDPVNKDAVILKFENGTSVFVKTIKP